MKSLSSHESHIDAIKKEFSKLFKLGFGSFPPLKIENPSNGSSQIKSITFCSESLSTSEEIRSIVTIKFLGFIEKFFKNGELNIMMEAEEDPRRLVYSFYMMIDSIEYKIEITNIIKEGEFDLKNIGCPFLVDGDIIQIEQNCFIEKNVQRLWSIIEFRNFSSIGNFNTRLFTNSPFEKIKIRPCISIYKVASMDNVDLSDASLGLYLRQSFIPCHIKNLTIGSQNSFMLDWLTYISVNLLQTSPEFLQEERKAESPVTEKLHFIFDKKYLDDFFKWERSPIQPLKIPSMIASYVMLLEEPLRLYQKLEIHKYISYFESRLNWKKRLIFWLTEDYSLILKPSLLGLIILAGTLTIQYLYSDTVPFYQIPILVDVLKAKGLEISIGTYFRNMLRLLADGLFSFCVFATSIAIKRNFGMGNVKDIQS